MSPFFIIIYKDEDAYGTETKIQADTLADVLIKISTYSIGCYKIVSVHKIDITHDTIVELKPTFIQGKIALENPNYMNQKSIFD